MAAAGHAQFIIASHFAHPAGLSRRGDLQLRSLLPQAPWTYEETEYYQVYRDFMADRERFL